MRLAWDKFSYRAAVLACIIVSAIVFLVRAPSAFGQAEQQRVAISDEPIHEGFSSWTLFLVCNQEWLKDESNDRLSDLFQQFEIFARVIGPKHLAVWFWRDHQSDIDGGLSRNVDVSAASQYCQKYGLRPSEGPFVVTTTQYPGIDSPPGDRFVLSLNEAGSAEITSLLEKLSDQLSIDGLDQIELDSEAYWLQWRRTFGKVGSALSKAVNRVTLVFDTKFFRAEVDLFEPQT